MNRIVVTGATGNIGGRVARRLAAASVAQLLLVRDPVRAPHLPLADVAQASFTDPSAVAAAIHAGDTVLMVSGSESLDRVDQHIAFIDAVVRAGAGHVVYTSFAGAAPDATFTWRVTIGPPNSTSVRAESDPPSCATTSTPTSYR